MHDDRYATGLLLWDRWTRMWNHEPALARELVAPRFTLHLTLPATADAATITDPTEVERWVRTHRARFRALTFSTRVGPFVDVRAGVVAGPWIADSEVDGVPRPVCGMDTIAFDGDRITEYWTISKPVDAFGAWDAAAFSVRR